MQVLNTDKKKFIKLFSPSLEQSNKILIYTISSKRDKISNQSKLEYKIKECKTI